MAGDVGAGAYAGPLVWVSTIQPGVEVCAYPYTSETGSLVGCNGAGASTSTTRPCLYLIQQQPYGSHAWSELVCVLV